MTAPDTKTIRAQMEALEDFTPGPWSVFINDAGDKWTGWPLSIDSDNIEDKTIVRPGGHWPYEWDAKTSRDEACKNARLIAGAPTMHATILTLCDEVERLRAENERLRGALQRIEAASQFWSEYPEGNAAIRYAHESTRRLARAALGKEGDA